MPIYGPIEETATSVDDVIVTAKAGGGAIVNVSGSVFETAPVWNNDTVLRQDGTDTGTPLDPLVALQVDFLDFSVSLLDMLANFPGVSAQDQVAMESLAEVLDQQSIALRMGASLDSARSAVQAAMTVFWGGVGDKIGHVVFMSMAGMAGAAVTSETGPGAIVGGGLAATAGYLISEAFPTEALAELSTDFIFVGVNAVSATEHLLNWSFSDMATSAYREIMNQITGSEVEDLPTSFLKTLQAEKISVGSINKYVGSVAYDVADLSDSTSQVNINLDINGTQNSLGAGFINLVSVEGVKGTAFNDVMNGNFANNYFEGGNGDDYIDGKEGHDTASYLGASSSVNINLNNSTHNTIGAGIDTLISVENVIGSNFDDVIVGNGEANTLIGGMGNDYIYGGAGDDFIIPHGIQSGNTQNVGTTVETNYIYGGDGFDFISFEDATVGSLPRIATNVVVNLAAGTSVYNMSNPERGDVRTYLDSIEGVITGSGNDTIIGNSFSNRVITGSGNDYVDLGAGDDYVDGEWGNDTLVGGDGHDIVSYLSASRGLTVDLNSSTVSFIEGVDSISGFEGVMGSLFDDILVGNAEYNTIYGASGADQIMGGGGNDLIVGGAGGDTLAGGSGNDTFKYMYATDSTVSSSDTIVDLEFGDIIDLSEIDANTSLYGDQGFVRVSSLTGSAGQMVVSYSLSNNITSLIFDINGDGVADMNISLLGDYSAFNGFSL